MLSIDDPSVLTDFEISQQQTPTPKKTIGSTRSVYTSRKLRLPKDMLWGQPVLCDLGQARIGPSHRGIIQPNIYKAPEVLFDMEWGFSVDIWNLGVMVSTSLLAPISTKLHGLIITADMGYIWEQASLQCPRRRRGLLAIAPCCWDGGVSWSATVVVHQAKLGDSECVYGWWLVSPPLSFLF